MLNKRKIIIDTDIGIDDAFALRYGSLLFDLVGITTVSGNVTADMATKNAKLFCSHYGLNIPVCKGASRALVLPPSQPFTEIHGSDGLGGCYDNPHTADAPNAVQFLIDMVKAHPHELSILAVGPLTNIALALNLCPDFADLVQELVIMGGAFGFNQHTGNMTNFSEFNIWKDPHAADQVMQSHLKITVVPLDVTCEVLITGAEVEGTGDKFLTDISKFYLEFTLKDEGFYGMAVHDALTVSYLYDPTPYTVISKPVRVVSEPGITFGQTVIPMSKMPIPDDNFKGLPEHQICIGVDVPKVKAHLLKTLSIKQGH